MHRNLYLVTFLLFLAGGPTASFAQTNESQPAKTAATAPEVTLPSLLPAATRRDQVLIAGQPSRADLATLKDRGISRVINLRTPTEMQDRNLVPFDEAAILAEAGIEYVVIPIGGTTYPFRPEALEAYAQTLRDAKGEVLLHCASGGRASVLHAAYEVKYLGKTPDEAMRSLESIGAWPLPLERLTGIELKVERRAPKAATAN